MKRFTLATIAAGAVVASLGLAPRPQYDYYLTGDGGDAIGTTRFGLGLMGGGTDVDALFTWMGDRAGGAATSSSFARPALTATTSTSTTWRLSTRLRLWC
jgi:hypothetical protein